MRRTYRQDPATGTFYEVTRRRQASPDAPAVIPDIEPFVSPLNGTLIGSRRALRAHNVEHGVTQHREYGENEGEAYIERTQAERLQRLHGQTKAARRERLEVITRIVTEHERN